MQDGSSSHPSCCRGFWPGSGSLVVVLTHKHLDSCAQAPVHTLARAHTSWHATAAFCAFAPNTPSPFPQPCLRGCLRIPLSLSRVGTQYGTEYQEIWERSPFLWQHCVLFLIYIPGVVPQVGNCSS